MKQICERSGEEFQVSPAEEDFCARESIPRPSICPSERLRQILNFRSGPHLHHGTCAISGRKVVTVIPPDSGFRVYDPELGDSLAAEQYGRPYNFSQPFFWQFTNLFREVPYPAKILIAGANENCEFNHGIHQSKDCYLCFRTIGGIDCLYSRYVRFGTNIVDSIWCVESEICYASTNLFRCYAVFFSEHSQGCSNSAFLSECSNCDNCFCCVGLTGAKFCFENVQLTEGQYRASVAEADLSSRKVCAAFEARLALLKQGRPSKIYIEASENSTGNYLVNTRNARSCFLSHNVEDVEYCIGVERLRSSFFAVGLGVQSELIYNSEAVGNQAYNVRFSVHCMGNVRDLEYCINCCSGCSDCFGCVGLRRMSYCIFNRQYSKSDYFETVKRIKSQMTVNLEYGCFFPASTSPFAFNHSEANDFLPLDSRDATNRGYRWATDDATPASVQELNNMPDRLADTTDNSAATRYRCAQTGKAFTLQRQEVAFHNQYRIGFSDAAPLARMNARAKFLNINCF